MIIEIAALSVDTDGPTSSFFGFVLGFHVIKKVFRFSFTVYRTVRDFTVRAPHTVYISYPIPSVRITEESLFPYFEHTYRILGPRKTAIYGQLSFFVTGWTGGDANASPSSYFLRPSILFLWNRVSLDLVIEKAAKRIL